MATPDEDSAAADGSADPALAGNTQSETALSAGEVARATLQYLAATRPDLAKVITRAVSHPGHDTRDPVTLTVAALVVVALQTEVKLTRNTQGRWTFTVHKHPMRDSGLGQVIIKLLGYLSGSQ